MMQLQPNYIVDSHNHKIAVQLDIQTYEKITETLENYALFKFMDENKDDEKLSLKDAKAYYASLKKDS
ncbi:MAG: hypothetical protein A2345_04895 [Sulfurimonas sp. RIFOXYB12_FULL_35_9]|nr:MAG: hypothetical protein A2345_04895 [Sulfurimonas sp. RIFOXYB12_FULL_35_9]